jgi:hypothetical protein
MVTPVPLPVMVLPNAPDWLPFSQPVKVPSSNPASGKEVEVALADLTGGTKDPIKNNGTKIHAALRVKAYFNLVVIFICPPQIIVMTR